MRCLAGSSLYVGFAILTSVIFHAQTVEVPCFAPDGMTIAPNDSFVPCNKLGITQQGVYSSCCLLDGEPGNRDLCAANGLCVNQGVIHREFCTDKTWKSPACVNVCTDPVWGGAANSSVELTPCADGTFCCGHNNLTCCGTDYAVSVPTQLSVISDNTTASSAPSPGIVAVAGLGISLGVVTLIAAGIIIYLARQIKRLKRDNKTLAAAAAEPVFEPMRPVSFQPHPLPPPSESPPTTLAAPSSHVPSMQEFAAFKALYGQAIAQAEAAQAQAQGGPSPGGQGALRLSQTLGPPFGNPHRLSELDGVPTAAAAAAATGGTANRSSVGASPALGFEPLGGWREEPEQRAGTEWVGR